MATRTSIPLHMVLLLVLLAAMWGGAFTLIHVLIDTLSAVELAAGRLTLGAFAVAAFVVVRGQLKRPAKKMLVPIGVVAMLDTLVPYMLVGWSQTRIESGASAVLISAMPLFTVVLAAGVLRQECVSPARLTGLAVGFGGVLVMIGDPTAFRESDTVAQLAVLSAAASYAVGALYARTLLGRLDAANFTVTKLTIGAVLAAGVTIATGGGGGFMDMNGGDLVALSVLGVVCTGVTFVLYFRVVAGIGSVGASTVTYMIPLFAMISGAVFLDEQVARETVAGMALIISGVAAVMVGPALEARVRRTLRRHALVPA
jgi:drug/metabolite transporter (DMT)-like permease